MINEFLQYIDGDLFQRKDLIIFDIGSRDCEQSIEFYHKFPNARIFAFECNPNTLPICRKNIENYQDRITLIEGAVCDYDGEITFYPIDQEKTITTWVDGNPGASSLFKSSGNYDCIEKYVQNEIVTNCHRLDTVMEKYNIPKVDIIWMDIQGAELLALKSLGKYLNYVEYVYTEVTYNSEMYTGQVMFEELHDFMLKNHYIVKNNLTMGQCWQDNVVYKNTNNTYYKEKLEKQDKQGFFFDIVIPVGPKDLDKINRQLEYNKKNIIGYRNIYIIPYDPNIQFDGCITIPESRFPFNIFTVYNFHGETRRAKWYLQQLLKLYAGFVIPDILERYLVVDSDTIFLKPTRFVQDGLSLYSFHHYGNCYEPYLSHMKRLHPCFNKLYFKNICGITHHMLFEKKYVKEMIEMVEKNHDNHHFYDIFLYRVDKSYILASGASEYEIYFQYMLNFHRDKILIRPLKLVETGVFNENNPWDADYVSIHCHLIKNEVNV
jgi:FkbM family methyltransferase